MEADQGDADSTDRQDECMACRGRGSVISNLGGECREVTCPWCQGAGRRPPRGQPPGDEPPDAA